MDVKDKKKKLTLKNFSGGPAAVSSYAKGTGNKSVLVEKKKNRSIDATYSVDKAKASVAPQDSIKPKILTKEDTAKAQKSAQEWARKKIQEELEIDNSKKLIKKTHGKKREYKLTLSKALTDADEDEKQRSLASFRRAREKEKKLVQESNESTEVKKVSREISVPNLITIQELANRMAEKASSIIKFLFEKNVKVTINHTIDRDTAEYIVGSFGHKVVKDNQIDDELSKLKKAKEDEDTYSRPPVVTVMGHVDHGKTSLLDALRETNVVATEHGGITQHIGAYQVFTDNNKWMTFIDTPGHAAFTEMRARGSKITDIVVLVVAANDGIKPQTIEAIQHAKAAKVPIIVAINKCDIHGVDKQKVRNQLLEHELVVEELGGDIQCVEISALKKTNLDQWGKIRAMNNFRGELVNEATPSMPVEIIGLTGVSEAGDDFLVLESESKAKEINEYRIEQGKSKKTSALVKKNDVFGDVNKQKELSIIIKSDVHGSAEALSNAILKIQHDEVKPVIVLSSVGAITETDVSLAKASNAVLIGFNIKPNKEAKDLATKLGVNVLYFNIIYEAIEHITKALSGLLAPEINEQVLGQCEILQVFKSSKAGKVAGIKVTEGTIINNSDVRIVRDGSVVYTGKIASLYREKNEVKEIKAGIEGGVAFKDFLDFKEKDIIEVFSVVESARTIN